MSALAGLSKGHAFTGATTAPPFVPGDALFNIVTTAVPYQALVGDLVLTSDTTVTTPVGPTDGEYFAVKNVGLLPVSIVGTVDGSTTYAIPPAISAAQGATWFVWNATGATWEAISDHNPTPIPIFLNCAAVTAFPDANLADKTEVRVQTVRDYFALDRTSTATLVTASVLATQSGVGRWIRQNRVDPRWILQTAWGINTSTGNDENVGSVASPIRTWAELIRRWGYVCRIEAAITITTVGNFATTDPWFGDITVANGGRLTINGTVTAQFTGALTAVTNLNAATNTETRATSTWTVATEINRLVINTTLGTFAWVARDLTGGQARMSPWLTVNETIGGVANSNSVVGNSVTTNTLPTVAGMQLTVRGTAGTTSPLVINRINFTGAAGTMRVFVQNAQPQFQNCEFTGAIRFGAGTCIFNNCRFAGDGAYAIDYSAYMRLVGGLCSVTWLGISASRPQCYYELRNNVLFEAQLNVPCSSFLRILDAWFFDVAGAAIVCTETSGMMVQTTVGGGSGVTGAAIALAGGCKMVYTPAASPAPFRIVTAGGDITFGGNATARAFDNAAGTYTAARTLSFANLYATVAAGGFGGSVNDPVTGCVAAANT